MLNHYSTLLHMQAIETQARMQRAAATERMLRELRRARPRDRR